MKNHALVFATLTLLLGLVAAGHFAYLKGRSEWCRAYANKVLEDGSKRDAQISHNCDHVHVNVDTAAEVYTTAVLSLFSAAGVMAGYAVGVERSGKGQ
jgi:hypothetical protein